MLDTEKFYSLESEAGVLGSMILDEQAACANSRAGTDYFRQAVFSCRTDRENSKLGLELGSTKHRERFC